MLPWMTGLQVDPQQPGEQRHPGGDHPSLWQLDGVSGGLSKAERRAGGDKLLPCHILR